MKNKQQTPQRNLRRFALWGDLKKERFVLRGGTLRFIFSERFVLRIIHAQRHLYTKPRKLANRAYCPPYAYLELWQCEEEQEERQPNGNGRRLRKSALREQRRRQLTLISFTTCKLKGHVRRTQTCPFAMAEYQ